MWILNDASDIFHVTDDLHSGNKKLFFNCTNICEFKWATTLLLK